MSNSTNFLCMSHTPHFSGKNFSRETTVHVHVQHLWHEWVTLHFGMLHKWCNTLTNMLFAQLSKASARSKLTRSRKPSTKKNFIKPASRVRLSIQCSHSRTLLNYFVTKILAFHFAGHLFGTLHKRVKLRTKWQMWLQYTVIQEIFIVKFFMVTNDYEN